jgi:phage terminase large subunit
VDGNWDAVDVDRPFAYAFDKNKTVKANLKYNPDEDLYLSFDFNVDPITCIAAQHYGGKIRILKEFRLRNSDIFALCDAIKAEYGNMPFIVTGDASGANRSAMTKGAMNYYMIIKEQLQITRSAFRVPSFNPSIKNSRVLLNSLLEKHPDFLIDASCQFLVGDLMAVESNETGAIDKARDATKTHLLDCFRYYLWSFHSNFVKYLKQQ